MKVDVDVAICEGHAQCMLAAGEVFDVPVDKVVLLQDDPPEELRSKVERAAMVCPAQAIRRPGPRARS